MESRRLITVLLVCLGVCLLVIGIFIGRETSRAPSVALPATPAPAVRPLPPIVETPPLPPIVELPPTPSHPAPAADSADKQRIAQYFRDVDQLQNVDVDDPDATAQSLIAAASSGDTSGLQKLVAQARTAEQKARAVTPPPACAGYHKKLVSLLADSREMLQQLERGIGGGNLETLPGLLTRANGSKARAETLAREEKEIKRRYGI